MSQSDIYLLLAGVMVLPLLGALLLRALERYIGRAGVYVGALAIFLAAAGCTVALARNPAGELRVGQLTVIQPLSFDVAAEPGEDHGELHLDEVEGTELPRATHAPAEASSPTPQPTATPQPTTAATELPSATPTPEPSATPTPEPSATPTPEPSATPAPTEAPPQEPQPGPRVYVVQPGDTIRSIAAQFDVSVEAIMEANNMTEEQADQIVPDQELIIP